jgi:hypothetical protein
VDLDADGELEVVVGNAAYNRDGSTKWANGLSDGVPAVADMDLDGEPEIVVVGQNMVWTLETDGSPTGWSDSFPNTNYLGPPAIDDLDGDGDPEFVVVGSGEMRAYHWDGTILWTQQVQDWSGAAGPVLFDFEMDGYPEVVYADETTVRIFNGLDGSIKLISDEHSSPTGFETPVVADVDADGQVEIVMLHGTGSVGISVYGDANESWPAGRQVWNQHAYSITNVEPEGGIPADQIANWTRYNNFRSGDAGLPPSEWEDLEPEVVEVCTNGCPGTLAMSMRILNRGTEDVTGDFTVAVRAGQDGPVIGTTVYTGTITSGMSSEGVFIEVDLKELDGKKPVVVLDRGAGAMALLAECDIGNNWTHLGEECP